MQEFAMVFPGQGSQTLGMLADLAEHHAIIQDTFAEASAVLGYDLWQITQTHETQLNQTVFTQPALLTAAVAVYRYWQALDGPQPLIMAGHSLGEYSALVCSGVMQFDAAVDLVTKRAQYMQEAIGEGEGAMAAIIGLDEDEVQSVCGVAAQGEVLSPANYNSLGQTVIAGTQSAIERALIIAKEQGAKIAKIIPVSVPSHCALMQPATDRLQQDLNQVEYHKPQIPVIHNNDVCSYQQADKIKTALAKQLVNPVRWVETIQTLSKQGIRSIVECGPGKVLCGLNKRIDRQINNYPTYNDDLLLTALANIGG